MNDKLKDWEIAKLMFGINKKAECKLVKDLRKHGIVNSLCEGYSIIKDGRDTNDEG